jgi:integrase
VALAEGRLPFPEPPSPATTPPLLMFRQVAGQWLATYPALAGLRRSAVEGYERALKLYAYPRFGDKPFIEVSRDDIRQLVAEMVTAGRSRDLIRNVVAPIRGTFNEAIEAGLRLPNPAARIGRFLRDRGDLRRRIDPLTGEEEALVLAAAREHYPRHFPMILCALRTGMRLGELLGLQWGDIDYQGRFIEVRRSLVEGGRIELPKNGKIRRVDLSLVLAETLQRLRVQRAQEALARGWKQLPEWVFCNEEGRPIWKSNFERRVFHKALERAKLRRIRFHDIRHTFASRLIQNGESLVYVKDQLGHHSIKVTVDVYGHLVPGANKAAVDRLDQTAVLPEDWRERLAAPVERVEGRHRTAPPRHQQTSERTRGATDRSVTPREDLVELRGLEPLTPRLPALCSPN